MLKSVSIYNWLGKVILQTSSNLKHDNQIFLNASISCKWAQGIQNIPGENYRKTQFDINEQKVS